MSCYHKPDNTALLKRLIAEGRVIVDTENGIVIRPDGKPFTLEQNFGGYLRFRVFLNGKESGTGRPFEPWFFVHKAVILALGHDIPDRMQIDHIDRDNQNNAGKNLRIVTYQQNLFNRTLSPNSYGEPAF